MSPRARAQKAPQPVFNLTVTCKQVTDPPLRIRESGSISGTFLALCLLKGEIRGTHEMHHRHAFFWSSHGSGTRVFCTPFF